MAKYGLQQLTALARDAGFPVGAATVAAAIALAESGGNPTAINRANKNGTVDYGLWQINSVHADLLAGKDWKNPSQNAAMAFQVYKNAGNRFTPWVTYNSGSWKKFASAQIAGGGIGTNPDGSFNEKSGANTADGNDATNAGIDWGDAFEYGFKNAPLPGLPGGVDSLDVGIDAIKNLGKLTAHLLDPNFWLRVGVAILGIFVLIVGLVFILSNSKAGKAVSNVVPAGRVAKAMKG